MSFETDLLIDRRRLKRRLIVWRVVAVLAVVAAVLVGLRGHGLFRLSGGHVALVRIGGIITDDADLQKIITRVGRDRSAKALIVAIDSPGGSAGGGEALHDAIARVAAVKPVVAVMGSVAASAGYMIAVPAARIFAREGTLTGSIGVFLEAPDISGLLGKIGVSTEVIKSGPLKDEPSLTQPLSPEGRQMLQDLVMNLYNQFVAMVAAGRHMDPDQVRKIADGRPYTGQQALQLGLIDAIGGEPEAREWLAQNRGIPTSLPVQEVSGQGFIARALSSMLTPAINALTKILGTQWLTLDGRTMLWQRSAE